MATRHHNAYGRGTRLLRGVTSLLSLGLWFLPAQVALNPNATVTSVSLAGTLANASTPLVTVGDFDGNGAADAVFARDNGCPSLGCGLWIPDAPGGLHILFDMAGGGGVLPLAGASAAWSSLGVWSDDLEGDGDLDLVSLGLANGGPNPGARLSITQNNGGGSWGTSLTLIPPPWAQRLALGDFDADGLIDIAVFGQAGATTFYAVLRQTSPGSFAAPTPTSVLPWSAIGVRAADLNGDDRSDLVLASSAGIIALTAQPGLTWSVPVVIPVGFATSPRDVRIADLDGNGDPDVVAIATPAFGLDEISLLLNFGGNLGPWLPLPIPAAAARVQSVDAGDLDGDGDADLVIGFEEGPGLARVAWVENRPGPVNATTLSTCGEDPDVVLVPRPNGDLPLVATVNRGSNSFSVFRHDTPRIVVDGRVQIGTTININLLSPADGLAPYLCGASFSSAPPLTLPDGRTIPLASGAILQLSLNPTSTTFLGFSGMLSGLGAATASVVVPNEPALVGSTVVLAMVILDSGSPSGVRRISPAALVSF